MGGITTIINKVKYVGIACLSLAILSTLILNIVSSYSSSKIESNAIDSNSEPSTLANDSSICNPTNTNAAACISLSITSSSSSSTGGNDANLSLSIPQGGGIATGRHTVSVSSNNVAGYYVMLTGNAGSPAMTPSATTSQAFIQSTTGTLANPTYLDKGQWGSWGIALPNSSLYAGFNTNEMDYSSTDQDVLHKTTWAAVPGKESDDSDKTIIKTTVSSKKTDSYPIYYGVRVDSPVSVPADTYAAQVVYTATTNEVPMPTITSTSSNTYELGSGADSTVTITGTNLASTYKVYIESNADSNKQYDITSTITNLTDTGLTVAIPTDQTNPDLEAGDYTIHVVTQGGEEATPFTYTKQTLPDGILESTDDYGDDGHIAVDYDENLIPVVYDESSQAWRVVTNAELQQDPKNWYDYTTKQWANALTVADNTEDASYQVSSDGKTYCLNYGIFHCERDPSATTMTPLEFLKYARDNNISDVTIIEDYVLGYWVYIPRYAYKVMRKEVADKVVTDDEAKNNGKGGFEIVFETKDTPKKTPAACSKSNSSQYYQDCSNVSQEYGAVTGTAWATHPAFTWQYTQDINGFDKTYELNGFWIGKFETTGTESNPTVLPNQYHQYPSNIGDMYDVAKSMGVEDPNNKYGNTASTNQTNQNNNNLAISTSHMLKNSEWGAVAYLASSKYGAGINNVQLNNSYDSGGTGKGPSGGAYNTADGQKASTTNNIYGVYDMAGGAWEYVMGGYTTDASQSMTNDYYLSIAVKPPYVDLYVKPPFSGNYTSNNNLCTWATCGGHALYETKNVQPVSGNGQSWDGDHSYFVDSSAPWFVRGGGANGGSYAGLFSSYYYNGLTLIIYGFRVALLL